MSEVPPKKYNPLVVTDKVWTGNTATRMQRGMPLPPKYENQRGVALVSAEPMSLADIASAITEQTGISVRLSQTGPAAGSGASATAATGNPMPIAYEGPLSGLMERVAGYYGVNWRYDGSSITITRFETRVFMVEALPGTSKSESGIQQSSSSGGGSGGGGGGGSSGGSSGGGGGSSMQSTLTQTSKTTIDIKYWDELGQILTSMLAGTGTAIISPSMGTVTITTTPEIMHTVSEYIAAQNQRFSRQIAINVEVYTVDLTNGLDFNLAFSTALKKIANGFLGNYGGVSAPTTVSGFTGGGTMNLAILDPNNTSATPLVSDIFTALSGIGDTSKVAKFPMITLNNIPVIRRIGENINYVQSTSTTVTGTSGTAVTQANPGTIQKGFTVEMTPRILDDGRILLDYSLDIIDIVSIQQFNTQCGSGASSSTCATGATGSSTLQLPTTTERAFAQQSILKSGSTLIMGGAEEEDIQQNTQGVGSAYNYLLGGGVSSGKTHTMIFFAITPQVVDVPHLEQG